MPPPNLPRLDNWSPLASANQVFSPEECAKLIAQRQTLEEKDARIIDDPQGTAPIGPAGAYRKSRVAWMRPSPDNEWVFARVFDVVRHVNQQCYEMDLAGFTEPLQIAEYSPGHYYDWHLDVGRGPHSIRKLSVIVQLTDPRTYQGGGVEILCSREATVLTREQGAMTVFPAYLLHRVLAVSEGTRYSLVGWVGGPPYR